MASTLFRRQLARTPRLAATTPSLSSSSSLLSAARRHISRSAVAEAEPVRATPANGKNVFDTHTVEDLHGLRATEILAETGHRPEAQMRHFTGESELVMRTEDALTRVGTCSELRVSVGR